MTVNHGVLGSSPCSGANARGLRRGSFTNACMGGETEIPGEFFRFGKRCLCSPKPFLGELSSAGSERLPYKQRVGGSNPSAPTKNTIRRMRVVFFIDLVMRSSTYFAAFPLWKAFRELSSAGSERLPYKQRVGGSNPSAPTNERRRLRFLKRLFLFSGRVGRVGSVGAGRVGVVSAGRAGRGGRCGSVWSVRAGSGRGGLGRAGQCGSVGAERGGGRSPGVPRRASGALLPLSCVRSGCSCVSLRASGRTAAVIVLSCARRCGQPTPSIFPCRLLHALLLPRLQHLRYRSSLALFYAAYFSCSSAASVRCGSMSSASSVSLGT